MEIFLENIGLVLGIASAIVTLVAFYKDKIKHNVLLLSASFVLASVIVFAWDANKQKQYDFELLETKQRYESLIAYEKEKHITEDAKIVAESIDIYGPQDYGKSLAHLGSIVGFYKRHIDKYESEYNSLSKQYVEWDGYFTEKRNSGSTIFGSDSDALRGLVKSNLNYVEKIGNRGIAHNN